MESALCDGHFHESFMILGTRRLARIPQSRHVVYFEQSDADRAIHAADFRGIAAGRKGDDQGIVDRARDERESAHLREYGAEAWASSQPVFDAIWVPCELKSMS